MKVVFTPHAREDIDRRFDYTIEHFGPSVAEKLFRHVDAFVSKTLAQFPFTGTQHPSGVLEVWVPHTPFFVIYRVDKSSGVLIVLAVFHHAQDRDAFKLK